MTGCCGGHALVAISIGYSLVAGFPEVAFLDGLLALAWAAMRASSLPGTVRIRFMRKICHGGLTGLALAAPALLPFLDDLSRASLNPREAVASLSLDPANFSMLLFPTIFGPPYADHDMIFWIKTGGYLGTPVVLLALAALLAPARPDRLRIMLGVWIVVWLAVAFHLPAITPIIRALPGIGQILLCRYCLASVSFAACILAALSLDDFAKSGVGLPLGKPLLVALAIMSFLWSLDFGISAKIGTRRRMKT